jgi:hypothetical protein
MTPEQQATLKSIGRDGWSVISESPSTETIDGPYDVATGKATQVPKYGPGAMVWVISDGKGHNQPMTVKPAATTGSTVPWPTDSNGNPTVPPGGTGTQVLDPPKDLPASDTKTPALEHLVIGGVTYEKNPAGQWAPVDVPGNVAPAKQDASQEALTQAQSDAIKGKTPLEIANLVSTGALSQAQADAVKSKTPAEIAQMVASTNASNASAASIAAKTPAEVANLVATGQLTQAQVDASRAQTAALAAKTPAEITALEASTAASNAQAAKSRSDINTPTTVTTDPLNRYIYQYNPATGKTETVESKNYHPAQADVGSRVQQLQTQAQAKQQELQAQVLNGTLTSADAQKQFGDFWNTQIEPQKAALAQEQAQTQFTNQNAAAATQNNADQNANAAAGTGASLLNNRATQAAGTFRDVLGISSGKNYGVGGAAPDVSGLPDAISAYYTGLGGGQGTYDTAANLVKNIDPTNKSGFAPHAAAALGQVLDQYHQQATGTYQPGAVPTPPAGMDLNGMLNQSAYAGGYAPAPPVVAPPVGGAVTGTTAPTTTIRPDGTIVINHVPQQATDSNVERSLSGALSG